MDASAKGPLPTPQSSYDDVAGKRKRGRVSLADETGFEEMTEDQRRKERNKQAAKRYRDRKRGEVEEHYEAGRAIQKLQLNGRTLASALPKTTLSQLDDTYAPAEKGRRVYGDDDLPADVENGALRGSLRDLAESVGGDEEVEGLDYSGFEDSSWVAHGPVAEVSAPYELEDRDELEPPMLGYSDEEGDGSEDDEDEDDERMGNRQRQHYGTRLALRDQSLVESDSEDEGDDESRMEPGPSSWPAVTLTDRSVRPVADVVVDDEDEDEDVPTGTESLRERLEDARSRKSPTQMLLYHLLSFYGCTGEKHKEEADAHEEAMAGSDTLHTRLDDEITFDEGHQVLNAPRMLARDAAIQKPKHRNSIRFFEGKGYGGDEDEDSRPRTICVHSSDATTYRDRQTRITYDCDSHFGWALNLSAFRKGFSLYIIPPKLLQMTSDLHLPTPGIEQGVFNGDAHSTLRLDRATHMCFGKLSNLEVRLYFYFPQIHNPSTLLTDEQLAEWTDKVFLPALHQSVTQDVRSSYPGSFQAARFQATSVAENRTTMAASAARIALVEYPVSSEVLGMVWDNIVETLADKERSDYPSLRKFFGAQIFFTGKGHKYRHQCRAPDLSTALSQFDQILQEEYDMDFVDNLVVDVGREVTPTTRPETRTAFWRKCCIDTALGALFIDDEGKPSSTTKCSCTYQHAGLRDLVNVTATPPLRSLLGQWGVLYCQWYSQIKHRTDSMKHYPFANQGIDQLAAGRTRSKLLASAGSSTIDFDGVQQSYVHSKMRLNEETSGAPAEHGAREEFRLVYAAFTDLMEAAQEHDDQMIVRPDDTVSQLQSLPTDTSIWMIPTREYLGFLRSVTNLRCSYIELILASTGCNPSPEQSRVILLMLASLRAMTKAVNMPQQRELWLYAKTNNKTGINEIGAGFSRTMMQYGFCWLTNIVNWGARTFHKRYSGMVLIGQRALIARYKTRTLGVIDTDELWENLGKIIEHVEAGPPSVLRFAAYMLADIVMRQFRQDVRDVIKKDLAAEYRSTVTDGTARFCIDDIRRLYGTDENPDHHQLHIHGLERRRVGHTVEYLFQRHFGDLDQRIAATPARSHFHSRPYRQLAWEAERRLRAVEAIRSDPGVGGRSHFEVALRTTYLQSHTLVPFISPSSGNLTELKKGDRNAGIPPRRIWIAIRPAGASFGAVACKADASRFYQLGGPPPKGQPDPFNKYIIWCRGQRPDRMYDCLVAASGPLRD